MTMTLVANPDLCTGCNHCVLACSARHENQSEPALARLSINGFPQQGYSVPSVCFHCKRPDCLAACPEQAIMRSADGIVTIDADICTGCGKCVPACPWGMVRKHPVTGKAFKCDLCGGDPACVAECAFGALIFVEWEGEAAVIKTKQMKFKNEYGSPELKRDAFGKSILNEAGRQMSNTPVSPVRIPVRAPSCDGLFMPAEWTEHEATWMIWPCKPSAWPFGMDKPRTAYAEVAKAISRFEPVRMMCRPELIDQAAALCGENVTMVPMDTRDSWARDSAPTFVVDGKGGVAGVDWVFNDWGHIARYEGKYDEPMALHVLEHLEMRRYAAPFIIEGGGIHSDGEGTLLTTEQVQFDLRRNAGFSPGDFEELFAAYLGTEKVIWLGNGLEDDETNGHVDILACFARPGVVLVHDCADPGNNNHAVTQDAVKRLEAATDARGRSFDIVRIPEPAPRYNGDWRMDLSYINFYIANGGIIMSSFDDPMDEVAFKLMCEVFPDREVVQIPCLDIFAGGGGIHCITQQQPKGMPLPVFQE